MVSNSLKNPGILWLWKSGNPDRGGGICKQKLAYNIKLHFRGGGGRGGGMCEQKLPYNTKLQFGGVGVYMSKS